MFSLEGGSLIGKGTYGCVFDPPLRCREESQAKSHRKRGKAKQLLGKITLPGDFTIEAEATRALGNLGVPYFLLADTKSACIPATKQNEKEIHLCTPLQANPLSSMIQFTLPYGGQTFYSRLLDTDFLKNKETTFFSIMLQMLEAGSYLISAQFCHYDVSLLNVLLNEKGDVKLIDFGMSFSAEAITEETVRGRLKVYNPQSLAEVPEMTIVSGLVSNAGSIRDLVDMTIEQKDVFSLAEKILGISKEQQKLDLLNFWDTSHAFKNKDWVTLWKLYWPTFDSWGIGMCLLYILRRLLFKKEFVNSPEWRRKAGAILFILRGLLQANPRKRLDAVEALKLYDPENAWFEKYGASWLSSRTEQRRAVSASV
jgi:serine/threonine protein kinase